MKVVQMPGGPTEQEDSVVGAARQLRVDTARGTVRVHVGDEKQGGHELPNVELVRQLIAAGSESGNTTATVTQYATQAELIAAVPTPNAVAIVGETGLEDIYVWKAGAGDGGTLTSSVDGHWHRLDSRVGFYVRLYRAGIINLQFGGAEPSADQDITAWLDGSTVKLWDGADYLAATPVLFARLLQKVGNYESSITLPDRLDDTLVATTNLNNIADTGWYKSSAADANAPSTTVSPVFNFYIDSNTAYQEFYTQNSTTFDTWKRVKAAGVWGAWTLISGAIPRLAATASGGTPVATDLDTLLDSGWYGTLAAAANAPVAEDGTLFTIRRQSGGAVQVWYSAANNKEYMRRYVASVWQAWIQIYPANVSLATGLLPRVNLAIDTVGQVEAEAGSATTDRIWTAQRVWQAAAAYVVTVVATWLGRIRGVRSVAGTTDTFVLSDAGGFVYSANGAATTFTIPPNADVAFEVGKTVINVGQYGAGQLSIAPGAGVTLRSAGSRLKISEQYGTGAIVKVGTNEWWLFGNTVA